MKRSLPLKVLSFTTLFPNRAMPLHGLFVKNRLERMARYCDLDVVAPVNLVRDVRCAWKIPRRDVVAGLTVYYPRFVVIPRFFKHWDGTLLFRQAMPQIQRTIALGRYDLVDVHYAYPDGVAGDKLARRLGKPFVLSLRGSDIHLLTKFPKRRELIRSTLKRADAVVAVSSDLRQEAVELGADPNKVYVMPNGVDTAVFFPRDWREARQALGWPLDHEVILSVGRLVPVKGFNLLIRAMREVRERLGRLVRCYIVGEGESRSNLENEVRRLGLEQEVILPGPVSPDRLPLWYSAANLFVLLSQNEGCPNVVLEALACGTPVVAAAVGGLPELVREGVCGLLVKDRSEAEAARRIEQALRMKWDRALIGSSESVKDWDDVARAQVRLFEDVVQAQ